MRIPWALQYQGNKHAKINMFTLSFLFILISSGLYLVWFIPYIYHVFHGRVVPHPFSWTVWGLFAFQSGYLIFLSEGLSPSLFPIVIRSTALWIWAILWWYYFRRIATRKIDYIALILAIITIWIGSILWASETMILMIVIDFLVLFPTLRKIWVNPVSEDPLAWVMAWFSQFFMILSLQTITFASTGYFIYNVFVNIIVAFMIYRRAIYVKSLWYFLKKTLHFFALKRKL